MTSNDNSIEIRELGPREGFQILPKVVSTTLKLRLIEALSATGVKEVEVTSFVKPELVPQMADADHLIAGLKENSGVSYTGLYLNQYGFKKSLGYKKLLTRPWLYTATSDSFLMKNMNSSREKLFSEIPGWISLFRENGMSDVRVMISTAFGCAYEGRKSTSDILQLAEAYKALLEAEKLHLKEICLADTVGLGAPNGVKEALIELKKVFGGDISLHLHDTRGLALTNVYVALQEGVKIFESSVGGMGGCPFTKGAAGNVATEDLVHLLHSEGFSTGVRLDEYKKAALVAEEIAGHVLAGRIYRIQ